MFRRPLAFVAVAALLAVTSCSGDSDPSGDDDRGSSTSAEAGTTTVAPRPASYREATCPMPVPEAVRDSVTCGFLSVPENRSDPESRTIVLAVATIASRAADPAPDPVVQLEGGPGFGSLEDIESYAESSLLDRRDLILFDQRGVGFSTPNLNCPESDEVVYANFATTDPTEVEAQRMEESFAACRERLVGQGVDLDGYDTEESAADVADLRLALGIDEWNLRGVSYGSILAQEVVRTHPEGIRAALIDSTIPPDEPGGGVDRAEGARRAFGELADACTADPSCASRYGDVEALIAEAAAALDAEPHRTTVVVPDTGEERDVAITGQDLYAGLFRAMYDDALIPILPFAISSIADGDRSIIDTLAAEAIPFAAAQQEAMTAAVTCADRGRLLDPDVVAPYLEEHPEMGALVTILVPETSCEGWDVAPNRAEFNELLTETDVPLLLMAGRFDPVTPSPGTARVAEALGQELILVPTAGHGGISVPCGNDIWFAFLDDPTATPDTSCIDALPPVTFG